MRRLAHTLAVTALVTVGAPRADAAPAKKTTVPQPPPKTQALLLTKRGDYRGAIEIYERLLKAKPSSRYALERLGPLYFLTEKFHTALTLYRGVVRQQPNNARAWYFYAYALRRTGDPARALEAYRSYVRLAPTDPNAHYARARCLIDLGKLPEAAKALQAFIQMAKPNPKLARWVARAQNELGNLKAKPATNEKADAKVLAIIKAARQLEVAGKALDAVKHLETARIAHPQSQLLHAALVDSLLRLRNWNRALELLIAAKGQFKRYPKLHYKLALCHRENGNFGDAEKHYHAHLKGQPDDPDGHYGFAELLRRMDKKAEALKHYQRYVALEKRSSEAAWIAKAKKRIKELGPMVAAVAPRTAPRTAPRPSTTVATTTSGGGSALEQQIRAQILAQQAARARFLARQQGREVGSVKAPPRPTPRAVTVRAAPRPSAASAWKEAQRRRQEAQRRAAEARKAKAEAYKRRLAEAQRKREEARRARIEAYQRRMAELKRKREEAIRQRREAYQRRMAELKRQREEAKRRREEAARRRREAAARQRAEREAKKNATAILGGAGGKLDAPTEALLRRWASEAQAKGDKARVYQIWSRLAQLKPGDAALTQQLIASATAAGQHAAAAAALRGLVKTDPKNIGLWRRLRAAQKAAGQPQSPLPMHLLVPRALLSVYQAVQAGQLDAATAQAKRLMRSPKHKGHALVILADIHLKRGERAKALALARRAKNGHPTLAGPYRVIGTYHLRLRDRTKALSFYRQFVKRINQDPAEQTNLPLVQAMIQRLAN